MSKNLELVTNGVSDYVIIYGKEATLSEITAAKELQKYIEKISGAKLPVFIDDEKEHEKEIIVGKTNREKEGDFLKRKSPSFLANSDFYIIINTKENNIT